MWLLSDHAVKLAGVWSMKFPPDPSLRVRSHPPAKWLWQTVEPSVCQALNCVSCLRVKFDTTKSTNQFGNNLQQKVWLCHSAPQGMCLAQMCWLKAWLPGPSHLSPCPLTHSSFEVDALVLGAWFLHPRFFQQRRFCGQTSAAKQERVRKESY